MAGPETSPPPARRRRNAEQTRQALLDAARTRFARDGYASTTVRTIADDAGVNVALINRYFASKEGLFEACLGSAVSELREGADTLSRDEIAATIARRIAGSADAPGTQQALLLMLRSSGDERVDRIRGALLRSLSERLAAAAGSDRTDGSGRLLRAQIILAASLGVTLLRSAISVSPIATATEHDLLGPLSDLVEALLPAHHGR